MSSTPAETLLGRLEGVRRAGHGFVARCPAHEDRQASLSVAEGDDGRVLLNCFAGCDTDAICAALGLTLADLFPPKDGTNGNGHREIVAEYSYCDEDGRPLYQVVRFAPKDFRQRRQVAGEWVWKLGDTRRVLYRLPKVIAAAQAGETVYVVEGEKDVHALEAAGAVATCNAGGAGKWHPEYGDALAGAQVVVVADKDEPGRKHAAQVAASLEGKAASVRVVEAATGKDAADHLAAGHTLEDFAPVDAQAATRPTLPAVDLATLLATAPERPEYLWFGYIARGAVTELSAKPKVGKSRLTLEAVGAILRGQDFCGHMTAPAGVLYLTEESRATFVSGLRRAGLTDCPGLRVLLHAAVRSLSWDEVGEDVLSYIHEHRIGLVVVDTLSAWAGLRGDDENSAGAALAAVTPLRTWADAGCAVLALRHERKGTGEIGESARGSSAFGGAVDIILRLTRTRGRGHETRRVLEGVGRFDETPGTATLELSGGRYVKVADGADAASREAELDTLAALQQVASCEAWAATVAELCDHTGKNDSTIRRALKALCADNVIRTEKRPRTDGLGTVAVYWHEAPSA